MAQMRTACPPLCKLLSCALSRAFCGSLLSSEPGAQTVFVKPDQNLICGT